MSDNRNNSGKSPSNLQICQAVLENMQAFTYWISPDKQLLFISPYCQKVTDYSAREFIQNPNLLYEIIHPEDRKKYNQFLCTSFTSNKPHHEKFRIITKYGETRWIEHECQAYYDEDGVFQGRIGSNHDITVQQQTIDALLVSQKKFRSLTKDVLDNLDVGVLVLDSNFKIVWINKALERYFGLKKQEIMGKDERQLITRHIKYIFEDPEAFAKKVLATYANNTYVENFECHVLPKGKRKERWLMHWSQPIRSGLFAGGRLEYYEDITARKLTEDALKKSEQQFRTLYKNSTVGIYRTTPDGKILLANPALVKMLGYDSFDELVKRNIEKEGYAEPYTRADFIKHIEANGEVYAWESIWLKKDGTKIWIRESARAIRDKNGKTLYYDGVVEDITERRQAEEQLRLQSAALNAAANAIVITDRDGIIQWINPAFTKLTGYTRQEAVGQNILFLQSGKQSKSFYKKLWDRILSGKIWHGELISKRKDGSLYTEEITITPMRDERGEITRFIAIKQDITDRKLAEQRLKDSEERFRIVFQTSPDSVTINRLEDGCFVQVNDGFTKTTGYTSEEVIGKTSEDLDFWVDPKSRIEFIEEIKKKENIHNFEAEFRIKNGRIKPGLISAKIINFNNEPHILSVIRDIEDLKELQKERESLLAESEAARQRLSFLLSATPAVIYSAQPSPPFHISFISENVRLLLGYEPEVFIRDPEFWTNNIHPDDRPSVFNGLNQLSDRSHYIFEYRFKHADGNYCWLHNELRLVRDKEGEVKEIVGYWIDITSRKQVEEALKKSERVLNDAQRIAHFGSWEFDVPKDELYWSDEVYRIFEVSKEEFEGTYHAFLEAVHPDDRKLVDKVYKESLQKHTPYKIEHRLLFSDGRIKWVLEQGQTEYDQSGNPIRTIGTVLDITEKKLAEISLRKSEERFRSVFEHTGTATIIVDQNGIIDFANRACTDLFGYDPEQLKGTPWTQYIAPDDLDTVKKYLALSFSEPDQPPKRYEAGVIFADGSVHTCLFSIGIIPSNAQAIVSMWDISDRIKAERERRLLYTAVEYSAEAIFITDAENRFIYANKFFEKLYGYSINELLGETTDILKSDRQNDKVLQQLQNSIRQGRTWRGYLFNRKKDGTLVEVQVTVAPILDKQGTPTHFISLHRDVTKEREIERRIQQSQRLEALGTLAGGIAHDFNNILTPILGYANLSMMLAPPGSKLHDHLKQIQLAAERARGLVHQILSFSRKSSRERKPILIAPIVKEALKLLRASIPTTIEIKQEIESTQLPIIGDPTEIHQVIVNLCTNAYQAMPHGGTLTVQLKKVELNQKFADRHPGLKSGQYLRLTIRDTGTGIPPEIIDKIFEPYFTTKGEGEGTGLGLATVHGIVSSMGGAITVQSELGKGTEFNLYFPIASGSAKESPKIKNGISGGNEKILFVDDEPAIAELGSNILNSLGYQVTSISQPRQALEFIRKDPSAFDLLITDMTMPGITGEELAQEILKIRTDMPIILATGYSNQLSSEKAKKLGIRRFIYKPYAPKQLAKTVREVLDEFRGQKLNIENQN